MIKENIYQVQNNHYIHPLAVVDPTAKLGVGVKIGPWTYVGPHVEIGDHTEIAPHVVINKDTKIGAHNKIYAFAAIGGDPQDAGYQGERTYLEIGDHNVIREHVTISRGSAYGLGTTQVGNHNQLLASSHIAHDCIIGNHIWFINHATVAGHVTVDDHAIIGAFAAVHQFCRVGAYSFLCHAAMVPQDVPPFLMIYGENAIPKGLNLVGLKRAGFKPETIVHLKNAYQILYRKQLKLEEAVEQLQELAKISPEVGLMLDVIVNSKRGIVR